MLDVTTVNKEDLKSDKIIIEIPKCLSLSFFLKPQLFAQRV